MTNTSKLIVPLGNLNAPPPISNPSVSSAQYGLSNTRFWREFSAGMKMFALNIGRNNSDLNNIFGRNLRLLHKTLKDEMLYQQFIQQLPSQASGYWNAIASSEETQCGLVNIVASKNTTIGSLNQQIQSYFPAHKNEPAQSVTNQGLLSILVISGKLSVEPSSLTTHTKLNKQTQILKHGNTSIQAMNVASEDKQLLAITASCQLLILAVPGQTTH